MVLDLSLEGSKMDHGSLSLAQRESSITSIGGSRLRGSAARILQLQDKKQKVLQVHFYFPVR